MIDFIQYNASQYIEQILQPRRQRWTAASKEKLTSQCTEKHVPTVGNLYSSSNLFNIDNSLLLPTGLSISGGTQRNGTMD